MHTSPSIFSIYKAYRAEIYIRYKRISSSSSSSSSLPYFQFHTKPLKGLLRCNFIFSKQSPFSQTIYFQCWWQQLHRLTTPVPPASYSIKVGNKSHCWTAPTILNTEIITVHTYMLRFMQTTQLFSNNRISKVPCGKMVTTAANIQYAVDRTFFYHYALHSFWLTTDQTYLSPNITPQTSLEFVFLHYLLQVFRVPFH